MITNCKYCTSNNLIIKYKEPHFGLYCKDCNSWLTWIKKEELQEYLDSISNSDIFIDMSLNTRDLIIKKLKTSKTIITNATLDSCFKNEKYEGFIINWDSNKGFGQLTILKNEDETMNVETETMADNEHKQFIKDVLNKLVDNMNVIE